MVAFIEAVTTWVAIHGWRRPGWHREAHPVRPGELRRRDDAHHIRLLARELGLSPATRASLQLLPGADLPDIDAELGPPPRLRVVGDG